MNKLMFETKNEIIKHIKENKTKQFNYYIITKQNNIYLERINIDYKYLVKELKFLNNDYLFVSELINSNVIEVRAIEWTYPIKHTQKTNDNK